MTKVFISYNRESETVVRALADDIEAIGHTVWFDQGLSGGKEWWDQILASVSDCDVFVFVLDPESLESKACKLEYGYAADLGKPILPVLVAEGVSTNLLPSTLSQIQFVDYRKQDRDAAFRLARALTAVPPTKPLPDPLPHPPEAPISYLGSLAELIETTSNLDYKEQSALIVDLKRSFREPEKADDTRTLLEKLRKRRDLFATIAEEIDELIGSSKKALSAPTHSPKTKPPTPERSQKEETPSKPPAKKPPERQEPQHSVTKPANSSTYYKPTRQERVKGAVILATIGAAYGFLSITGYNWMRGYLDGYVVIIMFQMPFWYFCVFGGAIAGTISGMNRRGIVSALILMGVLCFFSFFVPFYNTLMTIIMPLASPLGALVGINIKKLKA